MHSVARESSARGASAVVSGLGVALASVHVVHVAGEIGTNLAAVFYGSVVPFAVAAAVVAVGLWIDHREWADVSPWRLVGWCGAGAVATLLLALLHIRYQLAEGVVPEHRGFVSLMFVTYGAGLGLLVGGYDLRVQEARVDLAEKAWAMVVTGDATLTVTADVTLYADRGRLKTLFENLFRNAVEHGSTSSRSTAPAPVDVTVGRLDDGSGFYVEDTGPGIPPEIRERVFEAAFTTGGGSGLGLAIVRAAADAHGWSHTLTESATGGARFEFRNVRFVDDD